MRLCYLICLLLTVFRPAQAQIVVRGTVTDAVTREPLPAATVQVEGTYQGTITNVDGTYAINVEALPATLLVRFIGYDTARRPLEAGAAERQDIALRPVALQLPEITVTDENPAIRIMREVIQRKQVWRARLESYQAEAYNRFTVANDTGIVSIIESLTDTYWDRERGTREVLKSRRQTANLDLPDALPAAMFVANLYDDNLEIAGHNLMGVTHPEALDHYRFSLVGRRYLDDQVVYDIAVAPKNERKSAFVGTVSVLGGEYALLDVALQPGPAFLFPQPIDRFEVTYRQQFSRFGGDVWLPVDFRADLVLGIKLMGLLSFPPFRVEQVSRFTHYEVNVAVPAPLFESKKDLVVDTLAVRADTLLDRPGTAVPLSRMEQAAYAQIDSTQTLDKAFAPTGPMARFINMSSESDDDSTRVSMTGGRSGDGPGLDLPFAFDVEPDLWYNRVDALHAGLEVTVEIADRLHLGAGGGLSTGLDGADRWSYEAEGEWTSGSADRLTLDARYDARTDLRYRGVHYGFMQNGLYTILGGRDYFDYFRREGFRAGAAIRPFRQPVTLSARYLDERHSNLPQTTSYDLLAEPPLRPNPAIQEGRMRSVAATLAVGDDFNPLQIFGQRRLAITVEHSSDAVASEFDFTRVGLDADFRMETFYQRRLLPNTLDLHLTAGTSSGDLPPQRFGIIDNALGPYTPFGALHTRRGHPYEGTKHVGAFWEHNFRTVPFEVLGLYRLAQKGYNVLVFGGHARTWLDPDAADDPLAGPFPEDVLYYNPSDGWHHEVGVSLSGLFFLRFDLALRLDEPGLTFGVAAAKLF